MEYKILKFLEKFKIPFIIRWFFGSILIFFSLFPLILPLFPGSSIMGLFMFVMGVLIIIQAKKAKKVKYVIKIRKSIIYVFGNFRKTGIIKQKFVDIKKNIKKILKDKKEKKKTIILKSRVQNIK